MKRRNTNQKNRRRGGATVVEMAVVLPVFGIFMMGLMETAWAYMVMDVLNSAAKQSARIGAVDDKTTQDVIDKAESIVSAAFDVSLASVYVKDGSDFDSPGFDPTGLDYTSLPDIEVANADTTDLFIVRLEVNYNDVALLPPFWIKDITLSGLAVMRHE